MANVQPTGRWSFTSDVVGVFDEMVSRSVPLYFETIKLAAEFSKYHPGTICDLGCATGAVARACYETKVISVDCSQDMLDIAIKETNAVCICSDLRLGLPEEASEACFVTMLWTAQFIPIEYRQSLFAQIYQICKRNQGGFFIAEKLRGQNSIFQTRLVEQYHNWKHVVGGYSINEIANKQRSLENSLVSFDAPGIKQCLQSEGFKVEEVIRYLNFAAWYCIP